MNLTKQPLTAEEEQKALIVNAEHWNLLNPHSPMRLEEWQSKLTEAKAEGYISERCSCGREFLAFHHWTTCTRPGCPMSDGISMLDRFMESIPKEES